MTTIPMMEMPVPNAEDLNLDAYCPIGVSFDSLIKERQELKKMIEDAETRIGEIDATTGPVLDLAGVKNVVWNKEYLVSRREASKPRRTLSASLLLLAGVDPIQISAGYKYGKAGKSGIAVRHLSKTLDEAITEYTE